MCEFLLLNLRKSEENRSLQLQVRVGENSKPFEWVRERWWPFRAVITVRMLIYNQDYWLTWYRWASSNWLHFEENVCVWTISIEGKEIKELVKERDEIGYKMCIHTTYIEWVSERRKKNIDLENCCCVPEQFETKKKEVRSDFFSSLSAFKHITNFIHEMLIS